MGSLAGNLLRIITCRISPYICRVWTVKLKVIYIALNTFFILNNSIYGKRKYLPEFSGKYRRCF